VSSGTMIEYTDYPPTCIFDMFPGLPLPEAHQKLAEASVLMGEWLRRETPFRGRICWMKNESDPDHIGFFRIYFR
jgi:hypothetical protein